MYDDKHWMQHAFQLAKHAEAENEVPIGAVLVLNNKMIGEGWNRPITTCDPTAHAEIIALREGAKKINNYRLVDSALYVTLEPCLMCAGAIVHARVKRLVFGANDPKMGITNNALNMLNLSQNHRVQCDSGLLADECSAY